MGVLRIRALLFGVYLSLLSNLGVLLAQLAIVAAAALPSHLLAAAARQPSTQRRRNGAIPAMGPPAAMQAMRHGRATRPGAMNLGRATPVSKVLGGSHGAIGAAPGTRNGPMLDQIGGHWQSGWSYQPYWRSQSKGRGKGKGKPHAKSADPLAKGKGKGPRILGNSHVPCIVHHVSYTVYSISYTTYTISGAPCFFGELPDLRLRR